jgi:hypothetical protein
MVIALVNLVVADDIKWPAITPDEPHYPRGRICVVRTGRANHKEMSAEVSIRSLNQARSGSHSFEQFHYNAGKDRRRQGIARQHAYRKSASGSNQ